MDVLTLLILILLVFSHRLRRETPLMRLLALMTALLLVSPFVAFHARADAVDDALYAIRGCETGGTFDYTVVSANGLYFGAYQFSLETWRGIGGVGYPNEASVEEQDYRARMLYLQGGPGHWPVCGRRTSWQ